MCQIVMCWGLIMTGCGSPGESSPDLSDYYLPTDSLPEEGMTYIYRSLKDTLGDTEVWRHRYLGDGCIESINYGYDDKIAQIQYDRVTGNGVLTDSLILFFTDSIGQTQREKVRLHAANRFPFFPQDTKRAWLTHLEWWQPGDSLHIILQRRRYLAGDTIWRYNGQHAHVVRFRTEDTFETEETGWTHSVWTGEEWYSKGIGLVYYKRRISDHIVLEYGLEH